MNNIFIIGITHSFHNENINYPAQIIEKILIDISPDLILLEITEDKLNKGKIKISKEDPSQYPEIEYLNNAATRLNISILPIEYNDYYNKLHDLYLLMNETFYADKKADLINLILNTNSNSLDKVLIKNNIFIEEQYLYFAKTANAETINSKVFDDIVQINHIWEFEVFTYLAYKYNFNNIGHIQQLQQELWNKRNVQMSNNILNVIKSNIYKKVAIVVGAEHRYMLKKILQDQIPASYSIKEYYQNKI